MFDSNGYHETMHAPATQGYVSCCMCGISILPNPANMCVNCIKSQVDITEGIQKQVIILWCKGCGRYLQPPKHWLHAELESKELLTYCIKRVRGLNKVKLVDASFIWTEPHSMRLKTKLTIQAEVLNGAILQQAFVVDYVVERHMCTACNRAHANPNSWTACVQLRQHVHHKRTFFFLEQLILKHSADEACVNVKDIHNGIDFYFANRAHATKFIDFLQSVVPLRYRNDKQLVSHNVHTSTYNYKYTFSAEIAPVCKDDLVCLPDKLAHALGNLGPVVLVTRVTNAITLTDPRTLRSATLDATQYWRAPFRAMLNSRQTTKFVVLGGPDPVQGAAGASSRYLLAEFDVAKVADLGANDTQYLGVRTHLGAVLRPGNVVEGYDVANANVADEALDRLRERAPGAVPDVVLVRKSYEEGRRARAAHGMRRAWKLKRLEMEQGDEADGGAARGAGARRAVADADAAQADMERFMQELEEDDDLRSRVALYRDPTVDISKHMQGLSLMAEDGVEEEEDDDEVPVVPLEELLEDLVAMQLEDGADGAQGQASVDSGGASQPHDHTGVGM